MKKLLPLMLIGAASVLLAACHSNSQNKLLSMPKAKVGQFLYNAQNYASQKTRLYDSTGSAYIACVNNPKHFSSPMNPSGSSSCDLYLKEMLVYGSKTKSFSSLNLSDLKDKKVLKRVSGVLNAIDLSGGKSTNSVSTHK